MPLIGLAFVSTPNVLTRDPSGRRRRFLPSRCSGSRHTCGHPVGDDDLVHLAAVLRSHVRADDAVLSRLGGEIVVLLPGTPADVATRRPEELLETVPSTAFPLTDGTSLPLSIGVGVPHAPQRSEGLRALYAGADAALYEAKRAGRGRVPVASA